LNKADADRGGHSPPAPAGEPSEREIEEIAEVIEKGNDPYRVPQEAVREKPKRESATNLYALVKEMSVGERMKLAITGNREARAILINDRLSMVRRFVLRNPRITEEEIAALAKNRSIDSEILKIIARDKDWVKKYPVRLALATNPKTPLALAMHFVPTLHPRDLRFLAKSRNVPSAVNTMAKRLVLRQKI